MRIGKEIVKLANRIKGLSEEDRENVIEYVEYNEFGVAYELLCTQLYEFDIKISIEDYELIKQIGKRMKLEPSEWTYLKEIIDE